MKKLYSIGIALAFLVVLPYNTHADDKLTNLSKILGEKNSALEDINLAFKGIQKSLTYEELQACTMVTTNLNYVGTIIYFLASSLNLFEYIKEGDKQMVSLGMKSLLEYGERIIIYRQKAINLSRDLFTNKAAITLIRKSNDELENVLKIIVDCKIHLKTPSKS